MELFKVRGNTFCIDTGMSYIPIYKINDEEIIMLDTGWAGGERKGIEDLLEVENLRIAGIINSHAHIDHIGNNDYFKRKFNCVIGMSALEAHLCSSAVNLKVYYSSQNLSEVEEHFGHMICETDIMIEDKQDKIYLCGIKFNILHTPGHSPAHICIITPDNVAYLGDTLISYEVMKGSKMPYAFILREDLKSKEKLHALTCKKYIVAHKGIYSDQEIAKVIEDNINFYRGTASGIYSVIDGSMTQEDIFKAVIQKFNISIKTVKKYKLIERMLSSYVQYLNETGRINLNIENGFLRYTKSEQNA